MLSPDASDSTTLRSDELAEAEEWLVAGDLVERAFTFYHHQVDPRTQTSLRDRYVVIVAPGILVHQSIMYALFGNTFCAQYDSELSLLAWNGSRMRRYAYIRIGGSFEPNWVEVPPDV